MVRWQRFLLIHHLSISVSITLSHVSFFLVRANIFSHTLQQDKLLRSIISISVSARSHSNPKIHFDHAMLIPLLTPPQAPLFLEMKLLENISIFALNGYFIILVVYHPSLKYLLVSSIKCTRSSWHSTSSYIAAVKLSISRRHFPVPLLSAPQVICHLRVAYSKRELFRCHLVLVKGRVLRFDAPQHWSKTLL